MNSAFAGREALQKLFDSFVLRGFDRVVDKVRILDGGNGEVKALMKVEEEHQNRGGFLHGGMTAVLVDNLSSLALQIHPKSESNRGVSLSLNISFLKAAPVGEEILIKAYADRVGKTVAFLTVEIMKNSTGELLAKATHTKFIGK